MSISALDVRTTKLITTTQIITSVYAAVKELVENALDAGADNVEINLIDNGISLIEVKDNGCGVSREDAPYMGLSSYTSKISNFEDLDELQTFGFRGEALSALCTVAEVNIITKTEDDIVGTLYTMNQDGCIANHKSCHRSTGTTVQVKNLFKQVPVRRQMISNTRKASQAVKSLQTLIQCFGICKPNVRIQFRVNNNLVFTKPSLNNIKESVTHVLGRQLTSNMEWIEPEDADFSLKLLVPSKKIQDLSKISYPDLHYILVNNRPIKHKDLEKLVHSLILEYFSRDLYREKIIFLVYIILEPKDIDINLEPNKDTILFKNHNKVFDTVEKYVREFYGLKSVEIAEQDLSTSACYEEYIPNKNENATNVQPACKKRKLHTQEEVDVQAIPNKIVTEMPNNSITSESETKCQVKEQSDIRDQQHYNNTDALALTTHIQPNLSDSDSNDTFSARISSDDRMDEERESISQLPVVNLGEDFDLKEIENRVSTINTVNEDTKVNEIKEKQQVSLESWSKGHIPGLKSGTSIESDIAIGGQLHTTSSDNKINEKFEELEKGHVDREDLQFLKHVRSQVAKENPTLTAVQTAKKMAEFWKKLSSEERGYYRDIAQEEEKEYQRPKEAEEKTESNKRNMEKSKNRLLQLFEKMKNIRNEKKENLNMRTIVPWVINKTKIIRRSDFESEKIIGRLTPNLWIARICEQMWVVDITRLIRGLKVTNINIDKVDAKKIEHLLKQWLVERDDMSVMHSIYEFMKTV